MPDFSPHKNSDASQRREDLATGRDLPLASHLDQMTEQSRKETAALPVSSDTSNIFLEWATQNETLERRLSLFARRRHWPNPETTATEVPKDPISRFFLRLFSAYSAR